MPKTAADIAFRPATTADFAYCAKLYFAAMEGTIRALELDMEKHSADFRERWDAAEVRIITRDGADIGWAQTAVQGDALFLKQLFVDTPLRGQGIGTEVMHRLRWHSAASRRPYRRA